MLNEINRGYLVQKGTKGAGGISNVELINVEFRRGEAGGKSRKPPQTDWLFQDLQDDWDYCNHGFHGFSRIGAKGEKLSADFAEGTENCNH
jgi:hypothetical protein